MDTIEKTDYRKASPEAIYEARKIVIRMWKSKKAVAEIVEATGFSQDTVYSVHGKRYQGTGRSYKFIHEASF